MTERMRCRPLSWQILRAFEVMITLILSTFHFVNSNLAKVDKEGVDKVSVVTLVTDKLRQWL